MSKAKRFLVFLVLLTGLIPSLAITYSLTLFDLILIMAFIVRIKKVRGDTLIYFSLVSFLLMFFNLSSLLFSNSHEWLVIGNSFVGVLRMTEILVFFLFLSTFSRKILQELSDVVRLAVIVSFFLVLLQLLLSYFGFIPKDLYVTEIGRHMSFYGNPNGLAYFSLNALVAIYISEVANLLKHAFSVLVLFVIILSGSFSGLIGFLSIFSFYFAITIRSDIRQITSALFIVLFLGVFFQLYIEDIVNIFPSNFAKVYELSSSAELSDIGSASVRLEHIMLAIDEIMDKIYYYLFLGVGINNTNMFYQNGSFLSPHNFIVDYILALGMVPSFLTAVAVFWAFHIIRQPIDSSTAILVSAIVLLQLMMSPISYLPHFFIPVAMIYKRKMRKTIHMQTIQPTRIYSAK